MNEEKNKNMELNTGDLDAVSGGKIYHYPEKTESSILVTYVDDVKYPWFDTYHGPCAIVTSSLGLIFGKPYKYFLKIRNKEYEIVQVVPSIPQYPTCNVIVGDQFSGLIRTDNATLVQLDYSKMHELELN